ncbi:MAG: hypothetical protein J6Y48_11135, partial [Clostridia bacterium]|nr:hypothetical protein [Clostridia bacterium]
QPAGNGMLSGKAHCGQRKSKKIPKSSMNSVDISRVFRYDIPNLQELASNNTDSVFRRKGQIISMTERQSGRMLFPGRTNQSQLKGRSERCLK